MLAYCDNPATVNQQMFTAMNVCGLANQSILLLLMFAFLSCGELDGKPSFTKMAVTPLIMVRFSKFSLVLKVDESYKYLCAIHVCEFAKNVKVANINRARTFVDLQYFNLLASCVYIYSLILNQLSKESRFGRGNDPIWQTHSLLSTVFKRSHLKLLMES